MQKGGGGAVTWRRLQCWPESKFVLVVIKRGSNSYIWGANSFFKFHPIDAGGWAGT